MLISYTEKDGKEYENVSCSKCKETFGSKNEAYSHYEAICGKDIDTPFGVKRTSVCKLCQASFSKTEYLQIHIIEDCHKIRKPGKNDSYKTAKEYTEIETIKLRASNSKAINVTCPICDLPFMNKEIMENHIVTVHKSIKVFCPICDLSFMNKEAMENHTVAVHDRKATYKVIYKKATPSNFIQPPFKIKCKFCDRTFKSNIILKHHIAFKHSDENQN